MFNVTYFDIYRPTTVSGNQKTYQDTGLNCFGRLDPVDQEFATLAGVAFGKSFKLFVEDTEIGLSEADRLIDEDGVEYEVRGVQEYKHSPVHTEVVLEKTINQS